MTSRASAALAFILVLGSAAWAQEARRITPGSLVVRSGPGNTYSSIGTATAGQKYVVYSTSGSWRRIFWNGSKGWIYASYTTVVAGTGVEITPTTLNVYASSSTLSSVIGQAKAGDVYVLAGTLGSWRKIWFAGVERWVQAGSTVAYTLSSGNWNVVSSVNEVAYSTNVDVRSSASNTASVLGQVHLGQRYAKVGTVNGFTKIWFGHTIGYVWTGFGSPIPGAAFVQVTSFSANVWNSDSGSTSLGHVHRGQSYAWIGASDTRIKIGFRGGFGWVDNAALGLQGRTELVARAPNGAAANWSSANPSISGDGRYVAFLSMATDLVSSDTNTATDIFVYDRRTGNTSRVSIASDGTQADSSSSAPYLSSSGRYVTFTSSATNLVPGDTNGETDVFVHDRENGTTVRASVGTGGTEANNYSYAPVLSADGRYLAFASYATNLVPGDANGQPDVFVRDLQTGTTLCVSVATDGTQSDDMSQIAAFSADGRYVAFQSWGTNLVAGDTNGQIDIFLRDMLAGTTTRVSVASDGSQANSYSWGPSLSADGRYLAFASLASNLVAGDTNTQRDVFVRDLQTGTVTRVSVTSAGAQTYVTADPNTVEWPVISANGRHVAWTSTAYGLVTGDTNYVLDVFTHDRQTGVTARASVSTTGAQGNLDSLRPSISSDGRYVAFESSSYNFASSTYYQIGAYVRKRW